ncbi:MAG: sigma 54-interacting transcriptional regulator [Myxococcales bacterium]|nr:sigma 54-interacting transcriptional regulator [Myxococcales bacterium]
MNPSQPVPIGGLTDHLGAVMQYRSGHPDAEHILDVFERISDRPYRTNVLIHGEAGTGKEGLARALHDVMNPGRGAPFIKLPSGGRDLTTLSAHLFGTTVHPGAIARAEGGTLFLDEVGTIPREIQARLAPVLRGRYRPNDAEEPRRCDVCVFGATDLELSGRVADGRFRHDLFFRLSRIEVRIPPLRHRISDLRLAAVWVGNRVLRRMGETRLLVLEGEQEPGDIVLEAAALALLEEQPWDGNFRALDRALERALMLWGDGDRVRRSDLSRALELDGPAAG